MKQLFLATSDQHNEGPGFNSSAATKELLQEASFSWNVERRKQHLFIRSHVSIIALSGKCRARRQFGAFIKSCEGPAKFASITGSRDCQRLHFLLHGTSRRLNNLWRANGHFRNYARSDHLLHYSN